MTINLENAMTFMLILMRMTGMMVFSPILGRRNVPTMLSVGFAFVLAVLLTQTVAPVTGYTMYAIPMLFMVAKELLIGLVAGMITQLFLSVLVVGGEIIDLQLGISMAKAFDPGTNASISVTASIMNAMFILIFFSTNNHLTFIKIMAQTFDIFPLGALTIDTQALFYLPQLFGTILIFAMKLCLPIAVMEIIITITVGIIMRIVPQINIFVINIQFKLLAGIFALTFLVAPLIGYFENLILICFEKIGEALSLLL